MVNRFTKTKGKGARIPFETKPYREPGLREWNVVVKWFFPLTRHVGGARMDTIQLLDKIEAQEIAACYRGQKYCTDVRIELNSDKYLDGYV